MKVIDDDLWLCDDCTIYAVNGDTTGIDDEKREREVVRGVNALGSNLVPNFDSETNEGIDEFSRRQCEGCGTRLAGGRHRFAVLGEGKDEDEEDIRVKLQGAADFLTERDKEFLLERAQHIARGESAGDNLRLPSGPWVSFKWSGDLWKPSTIYAMSPTGSNYATMRVERG